MAGCGERKGRHDKAAQRRRGTAASGREGKRVGASDVDRQAASCRAGKMALISALKTLMKSGRF